jgi:CRP/FNR family transcriptional regulator, cyclic AMP receptor protein
VRPSFWRSFPVFAELEPDVLSRIASAARPRDWAAGEVLFLRGDPGDWLVALSQGRVKLTLATPQGRELVLRHAEAGDSLGELALFDQETRSADATALVPTVGHVLHRRDFLEISARYPALTETVLRYLCRRLRETTDQLESIALYNLEARLARFLLFTLRQLHGEDLPDEAMLRLDISQSEIAAVLGASRPKVNRALQVLIASGALRREADMLICDCSRLRDFADPAAD